MKKLVDVIDKRVIGTLTNDTVLGVDIGSRTGKAVLLTDGKLYTAITPTAVFTQQTADKLVDRLLKQTGLELSDIQYIVGTGYGRISLNFGDIPNKIVTEISCHAMGAHVLNADVRSIVDIGGQDSKAIRVDPKNGKVVEFIMNDKCAAGTGRFLEKVAQLLDLTTEELGQEALNATKPSDISSQCVVFAESEVISLKAKGEKRADIAAGIHIATARRIRNLFNRIGLEPDLVFTGGVSNNAGMKKAVTEVLGHAISEVKLDTIYAGALGGAIIAQKSLAAANAEKEELSASAS
ncbi:acyl-CoA dehydratase activase [Sporomusa sp. KB1]|jgi:predicted CoA-substrate-specific enzyme activase|uniref:acyl-CoA dehydratase activase n=1 Tax=Sporomusa sp. KB1 TaxID=943346 RepID=UPI00119F219B|nr:acyl-CoA dehydratase activase [Sporomusa sp. KB1]TWH47549.1 putative CoA-substrate-specific enzyme activase [Sporomusa sp. KB1]